MSVRHRVAKAAKSLSIEDIDNDDDHSSIQLSVHSALACPEGLEGRTPPLVGDLLVQSAARNEVGLFPMWEK